MSNSADVRAPLGMPPGSVRGILSLLIVIQFWLLLLLPDHEARTLPIPINLYLLMSLVCLFLVSHGKTIAAASDPNPSPLWLPGGTLRVIILGGTIALVVYMHGNHPGRLAERLRPADSQFDLWPTLVGAYVGGFMLGYFFHLLPFRNNWFFQAFLAWVSMISMTLLFAEIIIQGFVQPSLKETFDLRVWEAIVTSVTACYFGARS